MASATLLPIATIQHDFQTVISDVSGGVVAEEDIWVSCYKTGEDSVHGKVRLTLGDKEANADREVEMVSRDGVLLEREGRGHYFVSCPRLSIHKTHIRVPRQVIRDTENTNQVSALSVSPDLSQIAVGHADGTIRRLPICNSDTGMQSLTYTPHLSSASITTIRYFPSSRVLLSGGSDFTLHILDVDPSLAQSSALKAVRTLKGHIRSVTDTAIIGMGRNVLSSAKDGTVRLWDVGSGSQIRIMGTQEYVAINALCLGEKPQDWSASSEVQGQQPHLDSREVETNEKLFFAGLQDGNFECFDLTSKTSVYHSSSAPDYQNNGALTSVSLSFDTRLLATGSLKGRVTVYDTRKLRAPLCSFQRNNASIEDLSFTSSESLAIVTEDGLPFIAEIRSNRPEVLAELVAGANCEAVRVVHVDGNGGIWVAGDDSVIRVY